MTSNESDRVKKAYDARKKKGWSNRYPLYQKGTLHEMQWRERVMLSMLEDALGDLGDKRILDIGCGSGGTLKPFLKYGLKMENCYGVDILDGKIEEAKLALPSMNFACCSAEDIPFEKNSFDLVTTFTCLSSVLDNNIRKSICHQAIDMLRPGGWALVYDFFVNNPYNPDVKAVTLNELKSYFQNCTCRSKKVTLLPPLSRRLAKYSLALCSVLGTIPLLRTHRLTMFQKPL
ncbi:MAG: methyltransferase domain-containing protein [Planctomycetes bacterium]|nr:methyltransferase domain-containing protein [Planctomycetota bacterium]